MLFAKFYTVFDRAEERVGIANAKRTGSEQPMVDDLTKLEKERLVRRESDCQRA